DPYSLAHAAVGAILAALGAGLGTILFITIGWELAERALKDLIPAFFPHPTQDTLANSAGDVLSALAAWYLYRRAAAAHDHFRSDPYSLAHAAVGAILAALGAGLGTILFITIGWELAERALKDLIPAFFPHPTQDTLANSAGDVLSALAAWYLYRRAAAAHDHF